ncbi:MAG: (d)CMP kinase [Spirochaetia bacterium]|nr:(d)CMP kinase [Spirochaetota bacterium]MDW8111944.1 (d)CMP kinase [Spirochaetia bacterium]
MKEDIITIDGPVGVGKSTIAKIIAEKLCYVYLDTGAMYRALSLKVIRLGIQPNDTERVSELSRNTDISFEGGRVFLDGEDVSSLIRTREVEEIVSIVSSIPEVRRNIVAIQRKIASKGKVIMEGRDCGTVVAPNARYKFYLDASVEERARRRLLDKKYSNQDLKLEDVIKSIQQRDQLDRTRQDSPLTIPGDAVVINTDGLSVEDVVSRILSVIQEKQSKP